MIQSLTTRHVGPASQINAEFGPRLNLLTGDNDMGKSFLLEMLWWALTRSWRAETALPASAMADEAQILASFQGKLRPATTNGRFDSATQTWKVNKGQPPMPGLVIYASVDGGFSVWDPFRHHWGSRYVSAFLDVPFRRSLLFSAETLWQGLRDDGVVVCQGLLSDWVTWQQDGDERFVQLSLVLEALCGGSAALRPGPPQRVGLADSRLFPTLDLPYGTVPATYASAGIRRLLGLAYVLVWSWYEHLAAARLTAQPPIRSIILLLDEPEAHLHPHRQRNLLPSLLGVVSELTGLTAVQLIATTHSPLLCWSVEAIFDATRDRLFALELADDGRGDVHLREVPWRRLGSPGAWLVSDLFSFDSPEVAPGDGASGDGASGDLG